MTDKWQIRPLVREGAPHGQDSNFQTRRSMGLDTKTDKLTDHQLQCDSDSDSEASISTISISSIISTSIIHVLAAPLSARVRHGSSPTCEGSNSTHRRPPTLAAKHHASRTTHHVARSNATRLWPSTLQHTHRALPADSSPNRTKRRLPVSPPVSPLPLQVPTGISSPQSPGCHKGRPGCQNAPFKGHTTGILELRAPPGSPGRSDIITVINNLLQHYVCVAMNTNNPQI
jgi:hypothetical protein